MGKAHNDNVRVMVRVRPFNKKEIEEVGGVCPTCTLAVPSDTLITCIDPNDPNKEDTFPFDYVFWSMPPDQVAAPVPVAGQEEVYEQVGVPQLDSMFEGYNGCIFAYGQTSSGKTHSMMGYPGHGRGVTPRLCEELFSRIESKSGQSDGVKRTNYAVHVSFLEIYNEKVQDLLSKKGGNLQIVHDPAKGPVVRNLSEHPVSSWHEVERLLDRGMESRTTAATAMNDRSSRSHAVVILALDMEDNLGIVGGKQITRPRRARANLVDLAGSEKVSKSKVEGANLKEAIGINQSLTCLGRVIDGLVEQKPHIPYRDSVLTCLLQDSLGGNSRTTMLAALSPAAINYDETLSTLRYASRARKVVNKVKINEDPAAALIRELQDELERMKMGIASGDLSFMGEGAGGGGVDVAAVQARQEELQMALGKLHELEDQEKEAEIQRENQWRAERERIEEKHKEQMASLREEQEQLARQKEQLEEQHAQMTKDISQKRQVFALQKMKHGAQLTLEKQKRSQTEAQAGRLKTSLAREKFIQLAGKARLKELTEEGNDERAKRFSELAQVLDRDVREAQNYVSELENLPDFIPAEGAALFDSEGRLLDPDGMPAEEVVYDGPLCDMCQEQPAQFRCMHPPCLGDLYCIWCDANQHRYEYKDHDRMPIALPCECCGTREAEVFCPGCGGARMCRICDDAHHSRHTRTMMFGLPCHFCGLRDAQIECLDCPSRLCVACDELKHRSGRRMEHRRQYLEHMASMPLRIEPPRMLPLDPNAKHHSGPDDRYAIEYHPVNGSQAPQNYPARNDRYISAEPPPTPLQSSGYIQNGANSTQRPPSGYMQRSPPLTQEYVQPMPHPFPSSVPRTHPADPDSAVRMTMDLARERAYVATMRPPMSNAECNNCAPQQSMTVMTAPPPPPPQQYTYAPPPTPVPVPVMQSVSMPPMQSMSYATPHSYYPGGAIPISHAVPMAPAYPGALVYHQPPPPMMLR